MIDFRYLLVTVVSIFLALTIGITVGAGFVGDPLRENLRNRVETVNEEVQRQRAHAAELSAELDSNAEFVSAAEPWMIGDRLTGFSLVLFTIDGTDGGVVDGTLEALEIAGANVVTQINLGQKFALSSKPEADQLATILDSVAGERSELVNEAARSIAEGAASVASGGDVLDGGGMSEAEFEGLIELLEEQDFLSVRRNADDVTVPEGARFVVLAGSATTAPFDATLFVERLALGLARRDSAIVVSEASDSTWEIVSTIRESGDANALVSTVDNGEQIRGNIALVLALARPAVAPAEHFGDQAGAEPLPIPTADD